MELTWEPAMMSSRLRPWRRHQQLSSSQALTATLDSHQLDSQRMKPPRSSTELRLRNRDFSLALQSQVTVVTTAELRLTTFSEPLMRDPVKMLWKVTAASNMRRERLLRLPLSLCHPIPKLDSREACEGQQRELCPPDSLRLQPLWRVEFSLRASQAEQSPQMGFTRTVRGKESMSANMDRLNEKARRTRQQVNGRTRLMNHARWSPHPCD